MARYTNNSSLGGILSTASAAAAIAQDPALPTVVNLVLKLQDIEKSSAARGSGSTGRGVGLRNIVGPLETYVKVQEKPWLLPATART